MNGDASIPEISHLSLCARLAIVLRLFAGYCEKRQLKHPEIEIYLEYLWWFVGMIQESSEFDRWCEAQPIILETGLGYEYPSGFERHLASQNIPEPEFRHLICYTTEILYGSLFSACDEPGSRSYLTQIAIIVEKYGVTFPCITPYECSLWEPSGWGTSPTAAELPDWRGDNLEAKLAGSCASDHPIVETPSIDPSGN